MYRRKTLTSDCEKCDLMKLNNNSQMLCHWGTKVKILEPQKGKNPLKCNLKKEK